MTKSSSIVTRNQSQSAHPLKVLTVQSENLSTKLQLKMQTLKGILLRFKPLTQRRTSYCLIQLDKALKSYR